MANATREHFERAAADIAAHGDNDTLPFDIETKFISDRQAELSAICTEFSDELLRDSVENNKNKIDQLVVFSERLLAPTGPSGFRATTKIQPFWNLYFNGLGVCIASALETDRSENVHSYRFKADLGAELFDRNRSWRAYREATVADAAGLGAGSIVVQTDISSFYEHISHHHVENFVDDLIQDGGRLGNQINALLAKFSGGRSFGLPVGGQASRILAELFLSYSDRRLTDAGIKWHRYVDDYVLLAGSTAEAYRALAFLSHALADYGLTLNKSKTVLLSAKHYIDYVDAQLGGGDDEAEKLREIDLRFDPYSDTSAEDYDSLKETVENLQIQKMLNRELEKALPDTFLITQIGRTLRLQDPRVALELVGTLLKEGNLHAFRASWSTIMRGVAALRGNGDYAEIFPGVDVLLDAVSQHSGHLLEAEASLLHYLRALRFARTGTRAAFVQHIFSSTQSTTVKRSCIDCWRLWRDRDGFTNVRNRWQDLNAECQRLVWLSAYRFGDQGVGFRRQTMQSLRRAWGLGIERQQRPSYCDTYSNWCEGVNDAN